MKAPILLVLAGLSMSAAQAAERETLTLACKGTANTKIGTDSAPTREPVSMGVIVNFATRTVQGFSALGKRTFR